MDNPLLRKEFALLATPLIADACVRLELELRIAPAGIRPLIPGLRLSGRVLPARHYGSVDIFLETLEETEPGDVLVIDNAGRMDEACVGELTILEARSAGASGVIVYGCHRDTAELHILQFPVYTYGCYPAGPRRLDRRPDDALSAAHFADFHVTRKDFAFADDDGIVFVHEDQLLQVLETARSIRQTEREQADKMQKGLSLRDQIKNYRKNTE